MTTKCDRRMKETLEWKCITVGERCILEKAVSGFDVNNCEICPRPKKGLKLKGV